MTRLFEVGDRVRARTSRIVPAGTLGRIHTTLLNKSDVYFVLFDREIRVWLVYEADMEGVSEEEVEVS